jgi:hypothetical protein
MSTAQETSNKATVRRFHDATTAGDAELITAGIPAPLRASRGGRDRSGDAALVR